MDSILKQGKLLFALSIAVFGILNIVCARTTGPFLPVIPWVSSYPWLAYLTGTALLAAGVCIAANFRVRLTSTLLGCLFLLCDLLLQIRNVAASPLDVGVRTGAFETLAMCSICLILASSLSGEAKSFSRGHRAINGLLLSGRYLFALSAIVFGIDHYLVFGLIVSLVPAYIPGTGWFWANLTAIAFIAAGLSIAVRWLDRWAATLFGLMFLLWFLVLHAPRVMSYPRSHDPDEWSSAFIALAMCGGSWILASSISTPPNPVPNNKKSE
jgi:hypothetical protein